MICGMENARMAGYKFVPSGEELMIHLLHHTTAGWEALDGGEIVKDVDLYGEASNPWTVLEESRQRDGCWYVITKLKKAKPGQKRNKRSAGCGTWNARQTHNVTLDYAGLRYEGSHKYYLFLEEKTKKQQGSGDEHSNGHWVMDEYSFNNEEYAICKIRNKAAPKVACKRSYEDLDRVLNSSLGKKMRISSTSTSHVRAKSDSSDDQGVVAYDHVSSDEWLMSLDDDHYLEKLLGQSADSGSTSSIIPSSSSALEDVHVGYKYLNDTIDEAASMHVHGTPQLGDYKNTEDGDLNWMFMAPQLEDMLRSNNTTHQDEAASLAVHGMSKAPQPEDMRSNNTIEDEAASLAVHGMSMAPHVNVDDYSWIFDQISFSQECFTSPDVIQACN